MAALMRAPVIGPLIADPKGGPINEVLLQNKVVKSKVGAKKWL